MFYVSSLVHVISSQVTLCQIFWFFWYLFSSTRIQWTMLQNTRPPIMNPAISLLLLHQGDRRCVDYVADFCELSQLVDFSDVALTDTFHNGLNEPVRSRMPGGRIKFSLAQIYRLCHAAEQLIYCQICGQGVPQYPKHRLVTATM